MATLISMKPRNGQTLRVQLKGFLPDSFLDQMDDSRVEDLFYCLEKQSLRMKLKMDTGSG